MIYEYKCSDCGSINEFWMKMSDPAPSECPACKGKSLEKIISKTSFALKGSGWYTTDYKKASSSNASTSTSSSSESTPTTETSSPTTHTCGGGCTHK